MPTTLADVQSVVETLWPRSGAESWDAVGLVAGDPTADVILNYTGTVTMELFTIDDVGASYQKHSISFDYVPPVGTAASSIVATAYTPVDDSTIIDGGEI